jgi:predicted CXXCH cytochrome family protein
MLALALAVLLAQESPAEARAAALARCSDCHPSESAGYAQSGMARALGRVAPGELADLAPVDETASGLRYHFEGDAAAARLVETFPAKPEYRDSAMLAFAIGAGRLDRSYVVARGQRWWMAPLEVAGSGAERHAALAPGHALQPGTRFRQPVTPECLGCHTDSPPPRTWPLNVAVAGFEPRGISCGGCHGDVVGHVAAREQELSGGERVADPLAAEGSWSRVQRLERCAACHLQGDARIELDPARLGPPPPGTPLFDTRAVFVARAPSEEIGFVSQVQRLVLSRCYLDSAAQPGGGLSCETCHDPHTSLDEPRERERTRRDACLTCHATQGGDASRASVCPAPASATQACADCHLRKTPVFDVAGVAIHDHWIRAQPPAPSPAPKALRFPESPEGDWRIFELPDAPRDGDDDPGLWTLALAHGGHLEQAVERARAGLGARAAALPMLHHVRGSLLERGQEFEPARASYERALALAPGLPDTSTNLAPVLAQLGQPAAGKQLLDALLKRHPLADGAYRNRAAIRLALQDEPGFLADLDVAMRLLPTPELAQALAAYHEQKGKPSEAERWRAEARRLDPRLP